MREPLTVTQIVLATYAATGNYEKCVAAVLAERPSAKTTIKTARSIVSKNRGAKGKTKSRQPQRAALRRSPVSPSMAMGGSIGETMTTLLLSGEPLTNEQMVEIIQCTFDGAVTQENHVSQHRAWLRKSKPRSKIFNNHEARTEQARLRRLTPDPIPTYTRVVKLGQPLDLT